MSKIMKYMSIAALALAGALMSSCDTDDDIIENAPQIVDEQPVKKDNIVVVTTTVNRGGAQTKALTPEGVKTFAVGEQVAIRYWQEGNDDISFKAVSNPLTESDITNGGKSAKLTFTLVNPKPDGTVYFVYPAAMADEKGAWDPSKLDTQDGTLSSLAANLDLGTGVAEMVNLQLPDVTLDNQFTILAITLKNSDGTKDITNTITSMTVREVKYDLSYTVNRTPADGPIYVAIQYILESDVEVIATDGTKIYTKTLTNKSYDSGEGYSVGWRMTEVPSAPANAINGLFTISNTKLAYFAKGNLRYKSGSWSFFNNQYDCNSTYNENDWDKFGWVGSSGSLASETPGKWGVSNVVVTTYYGTNLDNLESDWGNVPGIGTGWRTLTSAEWDYLFNTRSASTIGSTESEQCAGCCPLSRQLYRC